MRFLRRILAVVSLAVVKANGDVLPQEQLLAQQELANGVADYAALEAAGVTDRISNFRGGNLTFLGPIHFEERLVRKRIWFFSGST